MDINAILKRALTREELAIWHAWYDEGIAPAYHRVAQERLSAEWPVLHYAIELVVQKGNAALRRWAKGANS